MDSSFSAVPFVDAVDDAAAWLASRVATPSSPSLKPSSEALLSAREISFRTGDGVSSLSTTARSPFFTPSRSRSDRSSASA